MPTYRWATINQIINLNLKIMNKTEFKKSFPFFSAYLGESVTNYVGKDAHLNHNYKTVRGYLNHLKKEEEKYK